MPLTTLLALQDTPTTPSPRKNAPICIQKLSMAAYSSRILTEVECI